MTLEEIAKDLRDRVRGRVDTGVSLAPFTTFRVGGPADVYVEAEVEDDLLAVAESARGTPIAIVGRGSNLLVSDEGFRGVAVRLGRGFRVHSRTEDGLRLGGAVYLPAAARLTARWGLGGFEFAAEIPATFGGAVKMNAGAHGRCMADVLSEVSVVDLGSARSRRIPVAEITYAYRSSSLGPAEVVAEGHVRLHAADPAAVGETIAAHLRWRREHQPPGRSAGSVFKNPPDDSAGRLIDVAGGKGMRVGGAEISHVHANFIVAGSDATAFDVWELIRKVHDLVLERTAVDLELEVRFLGSFP